MGQVLMMEPEDGAAEDAIEKLRTGAYDQVPDAPAGLIARIKAAARGFQVYSSCEGSQPKWVRCPS